MNVLIPLIPVHLIRVNIVNFMLYVFYNNKKIVREKKYYPR